jgi:cephalosporin hydroxylase
VTVKPRKRAGRRDGRDRLTARFFGHLVRHTNNFLGLTWLGQPIWQNVLDLWVIQETIWEVRPALVIETGTHRGGSAYFYAQLFDLMQHGDVISIDIEQAPALDHPRIRFIVGSSVSPAVVDDVTTAVRSTGGPVLVILDSDHTAGHVRRELELYAPFVTPHSFVLVQDGVIDVLPVFRAGRPGPLKAIREFLAEHPEFEVDTARSERFLVTHHPCGWLRRRP